MNYYREKKLKENTLPFHELIEPYRVALWDYDPPETYICPYCGEPFESYMDAKYHCQQERK